MYSKTVMDHFTNPRNIGEIQGADGVGEAGNLMCGDMIKITIKVADNRINDIKFLTFGCVAAIAVSSMVTELAKGKTLDDLPKNKLHCSNLGADAPHMAIKDYENRKAGKVKAQDTTEGYHCDTEEEGCQCPYCDSEIHVGEKTCAMCGRKIEIELSM
jgi:nitrogen fixation NifU-like protein